MFVDPKTGQEYFLGNNLDPLLGFSTDFPIYGDSAVTPMVREQNYEDRAIPSYAPKKVAHQMRTNMCNAYASIYAMEMMRRQMGLPDIRLSPGFLYGGINGGQDNGSRLPDAMARMLRIGNVPMEVVPEFDFNPRNWPDNVEEIAAERRVTEVFTCPTGNHVMSALHFGFSVVIGIPWCSGDTPDELGWLPEEITGEVVGGHALCTVVPCVRRKRLGFKTINSWGPEWGVGGWCVVPKRRVDTAAYAGAWAIRQTTIAIGELKIKIPQA